MSSGEAEYYAVKGEAEGLAMQSMAKDLGIDSKIRVHTDGSACRSICERTGIGRVRHMAVPQPWEEDRNGTDRGEGQPSGCPDEFRSPRRPWPSLPQFWLCGDSGANNQNLWAVSVLSPPAPNGLGPRESVRRNRITSFDDDWLQWAACASHVRDSPVPMAMPRKQLARLDGHTSKSTGKCDCKTYALAYAVFCSDECVLLSTVTSECWLKPQGKSMHNHLAWLEKGDCTQGDWKMWSKTVAEKMFEQQCLSKRVWAKVMEKKWSCSCFAYVFLFIFLFVCVCSFLFWCVGVLFFVFLLSFLKRRGFFLLVLRLWLFLFFLLCSCVLLCVCLWLVGVCVFFFWRWFFSLLSNIFQIAFQKRVIENRWSQKKGWLKTSDWKKRVIEKMIEKWFTKVISRFKFQVSWVREHRCDSQIGREHRCDSQTKHNKPRRPPQRTPLKKLTLNTTTTPRNRSQPTRQKTSPKKAPPKKKTQPKKHHKQKQDV